MSDGANLGGGSFESTEKYAMNFRSSKVVFQAIFGDKQ